MTPYKLRLSVPVQPDEWTYSFVGRTAAHNSISSCSQFLHNMSIQRTKLLLGEDHALARLSELTGASYQELSKQSAIRDEDGFSILSGQKLTKQTLRRSGIHYCPSCLIEDYENPELAPASHSLARPYIRLPWLISHIFSCAKHSVALLKTDETGPHDVGDFTSRIQRYQLLETARELTVVRPQTEFETYLTQRLLSRNGNTKDSGTWLDGLEYHVAAKFPLLLGNLIERGPKQKLKELSDSDRQSLGQTGFEIAAAGEQAIKGEIESAFASAVEGRRRSVGERETIGWLYEWLRYSAVGDDWNQIKNLIQDCVTKFKPEAAAYLCPKKTNTTQTIRGASQRYSIHPKRLRKILFAQGVITTDQKDHADIHTTFEASENHMLEIATALSPTKVAEHLNSGRSQTKVILDNDFLAPLVQGDVDGLSPTYTLKSVESFMSRLEDGAVEVETPPNGAYPLNLAAKRANCSAAEVIALILDNSLTLRWKLTGVHGYPAILVCSEEVKSFVHGVALGGINRSALSEALSVSDGVVAKLIDMNLIEIETLINPINRCPVDVASQETVDRFKKRFVGLIELTKTYGDMPPIVKRRLEKRGISPALTREEVGATFYLRAEVEE